MSHDGSELFHFSISGVGVFLGKSPVTIRAWERKGLVSLPRVGANRSLTVPDLREVAQIAFHAGRITGDRLYLIGDALGALSIIEAEENK